MNDTDFQLDLRLHDGRRGDPAGWYLRAAEGEGYRPVIQIRKITPEQAVRIARAIDAVLTEDLPSGFAVSATEKAVKGANGAMVKLLTETRDRQKAALASLEATFANIDAFGNAK